MRGDNRIKGDGAIGGRGDVIGCGELEITFWDGLSTFRGASFGGSSASSESWSSDSSWLGIGMLDISTFGAEGGVINGVDNLGGSTGDGSLLACANNRDKDDGPAPILEAVVALGLEEIAVMPSTISGSSDCFG